MRLYARGADDMKVSALVQACIFRELAPRLPYPIALQLVTDEEVGGRDGTLHQLNQGVSADFVIIGEGSGLDVITDSRGIAAVTLRAMGRSGHSAYPWRGDNALVRLLRSVDRILDAYPVPAEEAWQTTVNLARIATPNQTRNQIPSLAWAWLDIRFPPEDKNLNGQTSEQITAFLGNFCEPGVTAVIDSAEPAHHVDRGRAEVLLLQQAARSQGYDANFTRMYGSADGRFYQQCGMDAVIFGVSGDGQHSDDEYVDISSITPYYQALTDFLIALTHEPSDLGG